MHTVGILKSTKFSTRKEKDGNVNIATIEIEVALENLQHDDLRFLAVKQCQAVDMSLLPSWGNRKPGDLVGRTLPLTDSEQERYDAEAERLVDHKMQQDGCERAQAWSRLEKMVDYLQSPDMPSTLIDPAEAETAPDQFTEQPESETLAVVGKLIKHNMGQIVYQIQSVTNGKVRLVNALTGNILGEKVSLANIERFYEEVEQQPALAQG